jgi:hypothetical protein
MSLPIPVVNLGFLYINDLKITRASNTTLTVGTGQCRDSTNVVDMVVSSAITIDSAVVGANGIDTGTFAATKMYNVFLLTDAYSGNDPAAVISLSSTPTMPAGYNAYRLIGHWATNGSTQFYIGSSVGNGNCRDFCYDTMPTLTLGTSTSLAAVSLENVCPVVDNTPVEIYATIVPNSDGNSVKFTPFGSTATAIPGVVGSTATKTNSGVVSVVSKLDSSVPKILYILSSASDVAAGFLKSFRFYV